MTTSPQNPFVMQENHQPSFQLENQRRQMLRRKYTLIWGILLDRAPGFYKALGFTQHFMYWEQISPWLQLWLHVLNSSGWVQLNTLNLVHKQQWEPFQNAYHHSLSEWKTNIQTMHLMETKSGKWGCALVLFPLISLQRTGRKAHFIPFSSVRLGRHSGLSGGIFLISCFRSVVPGKDRKICNSDQANETVT